MTRTEELKLLAYKIKQGISESQAKDEIAEMLKARERFAREMRERQEQREPAERLTAPAWVQSEEPPEEEE